MPCKISQEPHTSETERHHAPSFVEETLDVNRFKPADVSKRSSGRMLVRDSLPVSVTEMTSVPSQSAVRDRYTGPDCRMTDVQYL